MITAINRCVGEFVRLFSRSCRKEQETILRLREALRLAWDRETAYPSDKASWTKQNPTVGQCAVTSLIVHSKLGGKIHKNAKYKHYWNELPSGREVDLTKDQFGKDVAITSEETVSVQDLLSGKRAVEAKTGVRYERLKKRVNKNMRKISPTVFVMSSNSQAEYIQDIIESIALPEGSMHHFRYLIDYLDPDLRELLPLQGGKVPRLLKGAQVIVVYLNQMMVSENKYKWKEALPVRLGVLKDCFKTGEEKNATAHFFFALQEGLLPKDAFNSEFQNILGDSYEKRYACLSFSRVSGIVRKDSPTRIFEAQCTKLQSVGLAYDDQGRITKYDPPLMVLIEGLYEKRRWLRDKKLTPRGDRSTNKSYYILTEATPYFIKYRTLITDETERRHQVTMSFPKEVFSTPSEYVQNIFSSYYAESRDIELAYVEHGTRGYFDFKTITLNGDGLSNALDCQVALAYETRKKMWLRVLDGCIDALFAIGPTYLVATKLLQDSHSCAWYVKDWFGIVIGIYGLWFVLKLIKNVARGK